MAQTTTPGLKILMLHGFTNTGSIFRAKTRALEKSLLKAFPNSVLHYLDGPHRLRPSEIPSYPGEDRRDPRSQEPDETEVDSFAWWRRKDPAPNTDDPIVYAGIEDSFACIAAAVRRDGPFDGVIGFSQGACCAAVVASLLEAGRKEAVDGARARDPKKRKMAYPDSFVVGPAGKGDKGEGGIVQAPLRFAVMYSGFCAPEEVYGALYEPRLRTPALSVLGSLDTIVSEERSRALVQRTEGGAVLVHPGGHFCPSTRDHLDAVVGFIRAAVQGEAEGKASERGLGEEKVEDMDMPF